jgi:hypothetical protein
MVSCVVIVRAELLFKLLCPFSCIFAQHNIKHVTFRPEDNRQIFTLLKTVLCVSGSAYGIAEAIC